MIEKQEPDKNMYRRDLVTVGLLFAFCSVYVVVGWWP